MNEILDFVQQNSFGSLATCNDDKADVRPFELAYYCDKGMFFYASEQEDLYKQLKKNPNISFCSTDKNYNYTKISGSILFSEDENDRAKVLEKSHFAKEIYSGSNVDQMKVFFLPHASCMLHFHTDNKVVEWQF